MHPPSGRTHRRTHHPGAHICAPAIRAHISVRPPSGLTHLRTHHPGAHTCAPTIRVRTSARIPSGCTHICLVRVDHPHETQDILRSVTLHQPTPIWVTPLAAPTLGTTRSRGRRFAEEPLTRLRASQAHWRGQSTESGGGRQQAATLQGTRKLDRHAIPIRGSNSCHHQSPPMRLA